MPAEGEYVMLDEMPHFIKKATQNMALASLCSSPAANFALAAGSA
jgi:hypothetical protein